MKRLLLIAASILLTSQVFSQDFGKSSEPALVVKEEVDIRTRTANTYAINYVEGAKKVLITDDLLHQIEAARAQSQDVVINHAEGVKIIVFSKDKIMDKANNSQK